MTMGSDKYPPELRAVGKTKSNPGSSFIKANNVKCQVNHFYSYSFIIITIIIIIITIIIIIIITMTAIIIIIIVLA